MSPGERRRRRRGPVHHVAGGILYGAIRVAATLVTSLHAALGLVIIVGAIVAAAATWGFVQIAEAVQEGGTIQRFDDTVMLWLAEHRVPSLEALLIELTVLGSWVVLTVLVIVAALFLSIAQRRWSVVLLLISSAGGVILTPILKLGFDRERPQLFEWADHVVTSSFPSGHASSAAIVYATIAYLVARLHHHALTRRIILVAAALVIVLVAVSRIYLGVHYPSDVIAGLLVGIAWAAFCMAAFEATQRYARRRDPRLAEEDARERARPEKREARRSSA